MMWVAFTFWFRCRSEPPSGYRPCDRSRQGPKTMQSGRSGNYVQYGGPHSNHATEMALPLSGWLLPRADRLAANTDAQARHALLGQANGGECRPVRVGDSAEGHGRGRKAAGSAPDSAPEQSGRARPDGTRLDWKRRSRERRAALSSRSDSRFTPRRFARVPKANRLRLQRRGQGE
jgi:hypothetical protein